MDERSPPTMTTRLAPRIWRPQATAELWIGIGLALVLPWFASWMTSEVPAFARFTGLTFLSATVAATLVGRLSASIVATILSAGLIAFDHLPAIDGIDNVAQNLMALALFVGLSFIVAYTLALRDSSHESALDGRLEIEGLAGQLAGERNTLQQVVQQMPGGVMVANAAGTLTLANDRASEILRVPVPLGHAVRDYGDLPEMPIRFLHADDTVYGPAELPLERALARGENVLQEMVVVERNDGSRATIAIDAAPLRRRDGAIDGAVMTFQDVTELLETQAQLARAARRLSQVQIVTDAALTGLGFDELADRLLRKLREILSTDSATLLILDRKGESLFEHLTVGIDTEGNTTPIPIGQGIAGTIASTVAPVVATDLSSYDVVRPWLAAKMRSLMGVPLVYRGRVTGVIHVATFERRQFTDDDVEVLEIAANRIASALERASLYDSRSAMSSALQRSLLPSSLPEIAGVDLSALYLPFAPDDEIGGDFYDVFPHGGGTWGVVVGDVSGKGPEAAAIMGLAAHSVRVLARYESRPSAVLSSLNEMLLAAEAVASERFVTACEMRLRVAPDHLRITLCTAGHPLPFIVRANGGVEQFGEPGTLLGAFADPLLHDSTVDLQSGDALVAYTDGLIERRDVGLEQGERQLSEVLRTCAGSSAHEIVARVRREMVETVLLDDDVAIVVIASR